MLYTVPLFGQEGFNSINDLVYYFNRQSVISPHNGDWRLRRIDNHHTALERYENGLWVFHSDFGGSVESDSFILTDRTGVILYKTQDGDRRRMLSPSLVDGGVALGCVEAGVSIVNNGRLESFRAEPTLYTSPILSDGTTNVSGSAFSFVTTPNDFSLAVRSYSIFTQDVTAGTKFRFTIKDLSDNLVVFDNVSAYDFSIGYGGEVTEGVTTYYFDPCFNVYANAIFEITIYFSKPTTLVTDGVAPKRQFTYHFLSRGSICIASARDTIGQTLLTTTYPLYQGIYTNEYLHFKADKVYRFTFYSSTSGSNPSLQWYLKFAISGTTIYEEVYNVGTKQGTFLFTPATQVNDLVISVAKQLTPGTITLNSLLFVIEEI